VWDGLILEMSVIGPLRAVAGSGCFDHEARQGFDDQLLLLLVEFLPQARLRNGNVDEAQIQLRHGSPGFEQIAPPMRPLD